MGDYVRINKTKHTFEKGYLPNWTQELFQISAVVKTQSPITYKIEDLDGELVSGTFYSQELQLVEKEQIFEIESIIDRRKRKIGKKLVKEIKVHWKGYSSKFAEGQNVKQVLKTRGKSALKSFGKSSIDQLSSGIKSTRKSKKPQSKSRHRTVYKGRRKPTRKNLRFPPDFLSK